ncbi:hypothetical protein JMK10_06215 [Rhodovulum sulfidophilum]|uniref:hypothetical protein n=1 Tax=Rhodovulum sulfidophilum TaxID=35806 RepID=UPI00192068CB|nr:hypothetical protein [Rhodovulum sulfidophilum]MBL3576059.1 hypothetical protein [Rhodovulum sulfidophilum]MCE8432696.1 hypothetical protein [Rhodovulum sulfidophilum]MCF4116410.1 hypothetical protein [Rhodovulum sulfidophilum]
MSLDINNFPLVWMSYDEAPDHDHDEDFAALEVCLKRGAPFVILSDNAPTEDEDHDHSQEERKRTALWMKKHKAELQTLVLAMIVIEPSAAKRLAFKTFGAVFSKFWGFPLKIAVTRKEAMDVAENLLSEGVVPATS